MLNEEKLELVVSQLVENIESRITFYSDEDREFFVENVVNIILLSEQDQVEYNLYCFLEHNYENHSSLQHNLNEGIGNFVKGVAKSVGRMLGFGKPAEKIAFGAPPTTTVSAPVSKDRDGKDGKGGGKGGDKEGTEDGSSNKKPKKSGDTHYHGSVTILKGNKKVRMGDQMSGNAAKAGRDLTQQKLSGNAQAQAGNVEDNRTQDASTSVTSASAPVVAQPNTQAQKAAAEARTKQGKSMTRSAFIERHGEEEGAKKYAAHREARRGQAANQRAKAKATAANQASQDTKQSATVDSKAGSIGDTKVGDIDFGAGAKGHTMGDGAKTTSTTTTTEKPTPAPVKPEPKSKGRSKKNESIEVTGLYSDYMNRFLKG